MAQEGQDFLALGLDITDFSEEKKAKIQEFITLFDTLSKYDGAKFSPILGDGLLAFNTSLEKTNLLITQLNDGISKLNSIPVLNNIPAQFDNAGTSAENAGKKVTGFKRTIDNSASSLGSFGRELTKGLGYLRTLAYILPGIGLAGIFNDAFKAIVDVVGGMKDLNGVSTEQLDFLEKATKEWTAYGDAINKASQGIKDLKSQLPGTLDDNEKLTKRLKSRGIETGTVLENEVANAKQRVEDSDNTLARQNYTNKDGTPDINSTIQESVDLLKLVQQKQTQIDALSPGGFERGLFSDKEADAQISLLKAQADGITENIKNLQEKITEYYASRQNLSEKTLELEKFNSDEARKLFVKNYTEEINDNINKNKQILDDDTATQKQKLEAEKQILENQEQLNDINRINTTGVTKSDASVYGVPENNNLSATKDDIKEANNKERSDNIIAIEDYNKKINDINVQFYERLSKSKEDISKDDLQTDADNNEKIYNDESRNLYERLAAYNNYVLDKQKIQQLEYNLDIQKGSNGIDGKTALTPEEGSALLADKLKEDASIQANAQKEVYDIVSTSVAKQLKTIVNFNKEASDAAKNRFAQELTDATESYEKGAISYDAYKKKIANIDKVGKVNDDQESIDNDRDALYKLKALQVQNGGKFMEASTLKSQTKDALDSDPNNLEKQKDYNEAEGTYKAYEESLFNIKEQIALKEKQLDDDELKRAQDMIDKEKDMQKQLLDYRKQIGDKLLEYIKTEIDAESEYRQNQVELNKETIDSQLDSEISANEASNLSSKDKSALDIQLAEQKKEYDKQAAQEVRKLKHDQAIADREIAIAAIIWNTEQAISKTYAEFGALGTPLALEQGIIGALEVATVLATPIPSYADGTPAGGHQGGIARYGEAGYEWVKKPYQSPYLVTEETIGYLPKGTEVIPINDSPVFGEKKSDGWEQTMYLAHQFKKQKQEIKNVFKPKITVDLRGASWKQKILGN